MTTEASPDVGSEVSFESATEAEADMRETEATKMRHIKSEQAVRI